MRPSFIPKISDLFTKEPREQNLSAWAPFWDCVGANFLLQNSDLDEEHPEWRMHWVYAVALLRTIGHVLYNVDRCRSGPIAAAIDDAWAEWKSERQDNWVFWYFIENERNNILKMYSFGVDLDERGLWHTSLGMDGVQLVREATYWWRFQLEKIESEVKCSG